MRSISAILLALVLAPACNENEKDSATREVAWEYHPWFDVGGERFTLTYKDGTVEERSPRPIFNSWWYSNPLTLQEGYAHPTYSLTGGQRGCAVFDGVIIDHNGEHPRLTAKCSWQEE